MNNITKFILYMILCNVLAGCGVGKISPTNTNNIKPEIYDIKNVYLDTTTQIPLPNGNGIQTGIYIHNDNNYNISGIKYFASNLTGINSSSNLSTTLSNRELFNQLGLFNPYDNNSDGFAIDPVSAQLCSVITAKNSCFLQFYVPSVDKANSGSGIIEFSNGSVSGAQIISWYDFGDPSLMNDGVEFGKSNVDVSQNKALTAYVIGTGKFGNPVKDINFDITPFNVMEINQGFTSNSEIFSSQVIAIEFMPTQNSTQTVNTLITPRVNNVSYTPLNLQIMPTIQGNLTMGNIPILTNLNKTTTISLRNNGSANINNLQIIVPESIVSITSNSCAQTLSANSICSYTVQVVSSLESNQNASIRYTYQGGSKQQQLIYINESMLDNYPYLNVSPSRNEITTNTGIYINLNFVVTNLSSVPQTLLESNFVYSANTSTATMSIISNSCLGKILNKNDSCVIYAQFKGLAIGSGGLYAGFKANYKNKDYYFKGGMDYVMSNLSGVVTVSPANFNFNITGDGTSYATQAISVLNSGMAPLNIESIFLESADSHFIVDASSCLTKNILLANESCSVSITISPKTIFVGESGSNNLAVEFQTLGKNYVARAGFSWQIMPMDTQLSITNVQLTNIASGAGTAGSPYQSWSINANPVVSITYKNTSSTTKMTNFVLETNLINPYWQVSPSLSTCGYGVNTTTLNPVESCVLTLVFESGYTSNVSSVNTSINLPTASWNAYGKLITQNSINYNSQGSLYFIYSNKTSSVQINNNNSNSKTKSIVLSSLSGSGTATITISAISSDIIPTVSGGGCVANTNGSVTCTNLGGGMATITYTIPSWVIAPLTVPILITADKPVYFSNNGKFIIFNYTN